MPNRREHQRSFESPHSSHKGISRVIRENKRIEAEERNKRKLIDKTRAFWRARGFTRQSEAALLIVHTVTDVNARASEQRQRASDWDKVPTDITEQMI